VTIPGVFSLKDKRLKEGKMHLKEIARIGVLTAGTFAVLVMARPAAIAAKAKVGASKEVVWPAKEIKFEKTPVNGVTKADLWGNSDTGAHGTLTRFEATTDNGLHTHANAVRVVVISGNFLYGSGEEPAKKFGPGSYIFIPAGMKHTSGCDAGETCLFFEEQSGKFDLKPVKAAAGAAKTK
jgi:quercetin dioxygenase-like cupin family protein